MRSFIVSTSCGCHCTSYSLQYVSDQWWTGACYVDTSCNSLKYFFGEAWCQSAAYSTNVDMQCPAVRSLMCLLCVLSDALRDEPEDVFRKSLKTLFLDNISVLSALEVFTTMRSINRRFTYLLTLVSDLISLLHSMSLWVQLFKLLFDVDESWCTKIKVDHSTVSVSLLKSLFNTCIVYAIHSRHILAPLLFS